MKVDPTGLGAAAQRIAAKAAASAAGAPLHPPLGADQASVEAAARLSTAGTEVLTLLAAQVSALASTAKQLGISSLMFSEQETINSAATVTLSHGGGPTVASGFAAPAPTVPADVRPEFGPAAPLPGEAISTLVHSGPGGDAGAGFTSSMDEVVLFSTDASSVIQGVVDELPDIWDSPNSMPVADHLMDHASGLQLSSQWAQTLIEQARAHSDQYGQAATDIPTPQEFASVNAQLEQALAINAASGGRYAALVANLMTRKQALETRAQQGYSAYQVSTEFTTASTTDPAGIVSTVATMTMSLASGVASGLGVATGTTLGLLGGMLPLSPADLTGDLAQTEDTAQDSDTEDDTSDTAAPEDDDTALSDGSDDPLAAGADPLAAEQDPLAAGSTDQMSSMLPMMMTTALGAAGGVLGTVGKIPETLTQAATQAVSAATQGLSSALGSPAEIDTGATDVSDIGDLGGPGVDSFSPGGTGPADTTPAAGTQLSSVAPSTGTTPTIAPIPAGATGPVASAPTHSGYGGGMGMPFMPMNGMAGGQQPGNGDKREEANRKLVPPRVPHAEQVTGKVTAERVAVAASPDEPARPPNPASDDTTGGGGPARPIVRRITTQPRDQP